MPLGKLRAGFLGTAVGRQTLLHFLGAALVPVLVSSLLGIWYVRQTLISEATERVDRTAESAALILLRQLTTLARETTERPVATLETEPTGLFDAADGTPEESRGGVAFANCASWWRRSVEKSQRDADAPSRHPTGRSARAPSPPRKSGIRSMN